MDLFGTAGIRGDVRNTVTPSLALSVGRAVGIDGDEFVVGRDGRETSAALAAAVDAGLQSAGADVIRIGQVPTPALAYASRDRHGVMVTASHNPPPDNGLKLFADGTEYSRQRERTVESRTAEARNPVAWDEWGDSRRADLLEDYRSAVASFAGETVGTCESIRVVVDCGNGMASLATPQVLRELGADVVALNANVDGHFPGRESKPTARSLADLRSFVAGDADLGIGHDGDADRIVIVDGEGEVVHEDTVLAIVAEFYAHRSEAGDPVVVTTPNASGRIDDRVESVGARVERVRLGALHEGIEDVFETGTEETDVVFAAEPWKHIHPAFGSWIDGVVSAAVLAGLVADRGLEELRKPVFERPYRKVNVECPDDRKRAAMESIAVDLPAAFPDADVDTEHGVRLTFPDASWALVRPSGTEPYVRIYAESDDVDALVETTVDVVEAAVAG